MLPRRLALVSLAAAAFACSRDAGPAAIPRAPALGTVDAERVLATHSVAITLRARGRVVPGTLVAPPGPGPWPAIVLLAGSGPTDRDWTSPLLPGTNGSGKLLAEELARHGAVVVRFDKAGSGKNPGPPLAEWTIDAYRDEALAALDLVRARRDVRPDRVFVAGHSEGGIHATRLALAAPGRIAGVLYLASASRTMADTMLTQLESQLTNPMAMVPPDQVRREMDSLRGAMTEILAGRPVDAARVSKIPQLQRLIASLAAPATAPLTAGLLGFDNAAEAPKLTVPMFVVSGGKDVQIDPELDTRRLAEALRAANREVTLHIAPAADHVLKYEPASVLELRADLTAVQNGYNAPHRALDPDVTRAILAWLGERTR